MRPALLERALVDAHVAAGPDFPDSALVHVVVLVEAAFPPLLRKHARAARPRLVAAGRHQVTKTPFGRLAVSGHVHDVLQLRVIEQKTVDRAVHTPGKILAEAGAIEPAQPRLAAEGAAHEADLAVVAEQVHDFVVETFVEVVAVSVL